MTDRKKTSDGAEPEGNPKINTSSEPSFTLEDLIILTKQFEEELIEGEPLEEFFEDDFDFDPALLASEEGYGGAIRGLTTALWDRRIEIAIFIAIMMFMIRRAFTDAWTQGAAEAGISFNELTPQEISALNGEIAVDVGSLAGFAVAIAGGARALGGPLQPLLNRAELWQNRYGEIKAFALQMAAKNQKLMWVWNPLKDHCDDCLKYNGRVYRARIWENAGIRPRMSELECGGWHCGCSFVLTDDPAMPGRPPLPSGA